MILSGRYIGYPPVSSAARWAAGWVAIDRMRSLLPERFRLITDIETVTRKGAALSLVSQAFLDLMREMRRSRLMRGFSTSDPCLWARRWQIRIR
jgi:hypothetical protein